MKKIFLLVFLVSLLLTINDINAQLTTDSNNVVLEEATGTWCGWCPCAHEYLTTIKSMRPQTVIILYHGPTGSADPWNATGGPVISFLGMSSYPTAVLGRVTGPIGRTSWVGQVSYQSTLAPPMKLTVTNQTLNLATRTISANIDAKALQNYTDTTVSYNIFYIITENNLVYPQNFYSGCGTAGYHNDYVHYHVSRAIVNGTSGELLKSGAWLQDSVVTKQLSYVIPAGIDLANIDLNIIVYKNTPPISTNGAVQSAMFIKRSQMVLTGVSNTEIVPNKYSLEQNYPNPFNPTTNIRFTVPKNGFASLKIYDMSGKEVSTYLDGYITAGSYTAPFDGSQLSSGVYFYRLTAGDFVETKKMMLVK
jgi:hypothetical protein